MDTITLTQVGNWAVVGGKWYPRVSMDHGAAYLKGPMGNLRAESHEIDQFVNVRGNATWRGGRVTLMEYRDHAHVWIVTIDRSLMERESATLDGNVYDGGQAIVPADELSDIQLWAVHWLRADGSDRVVREYPTTPPQ